MRELKEEERGCEGRDGKNKTKTGIAYNQPGVN